MKHTPGPWISHLFDGVGNWFIKSVPKDGNEIYIALIDNTRPDIVSNMANANLIAAAPELLEALENLLDIEKTNGHMDKIYFEGKAINAIKKAKGEL